MSMDKSRMDLDILFSSSLQVASESTKAVANDAERLREKVKESMIKRRASEDSNA